MSDPLEFTGERFTPECVREIRYEHVHRYVFARGLVKGLRVLDAACGEGYGSALLARQVGQKKAREIFFVGLNYSAQEGAEMGMVNAVVPHAELENFALSWGREINA